MKRPGLVPSAPRRHTHRTHGRSLLAAKLREFLCERGICSGQHGNSEERRVGGARVADGEGGDRHAFGHLHDGIQGIYAVQMRGGNGHAQDRHCRLRGQHARQMRSAPRTGDDATQAAIGCCFRVGKHFVGHAMRRQHVAFVRNTEGDQLRGGVLHYFPVALAAHHNPD